MGSTFGKNLKISLFGESHGTALGMVIDGLPSGIEINEEQIYIELSKRKPQGEISTTRHEEDKVNFLSGVFEHRTTGSPLTFMIENKDTKSSDYNKSIARPSHADLTAYLKYEGFNDYRGGGHFSGRITAAIVVLGAICKALLKEKNVAIASHIKRIGNIQDADFTSDNLQSEMELLNAKYFAVIDEEKAQEMQELINKTRMEEDSIGGELETVVTGLEAGIGEPYFDSIEAILSHLLFSIGGVKGVTFGDGVDFATSRGSKVNDQMEIKDGEVNYLSNHNGGINGGISNGQNILIHTYVKPTPSIATKQKSVDFITKENVDLEIKGRHDPCIVHRVRSVVDALVAYGLVDLIMENQAHKWSK